jgi:hypothetical protein
MVAVESEIHGQLSGCCGPLLAGCVMPPLAGDLGLNMTILLYDSHSWIPNALTPGIRSFPTICRAAERSVVPVGSRSNSLIRGGN